MFDLEKLITTYLETHPKIQFCDIVKLIFQRAKGIGHFISSRENAKLALENELNSLPNSNIQIESQTMLSDYLARISLLAVQNGAVNKEMLLDAMLTTCNLPCKPFNIFKSEMLLAKNMFELKYGNVKKISLKKLYNTPTSHSEIFRAAYSPHYRVIDIRAYKFHTIINAIENELQSNKAIITIAIDGKSSSGKTELCEFLKLLFDFNLFHMDDFFIPEKLKTQKRMNECGGNVDYERFEREVIHNLITKKNSFSYRVFDCSLQKNGYNKKFKFKRLNIIEGAYSTHPAFKMHYDVVIGLNIDRLVQIERIKNRYPLNDYLINRHLNEWIPMENKFIEQTKLFDNANIVINNSSDDITSY